MQGGRNPRARVLRLLELAPKPPGHGDVERADAGVWLAPFNVLLGAADGLGHHVPMAPPEAVPPP